MKVLVANRGEIACRIIRAINEMQYESVAIYSLEDKESEHVKMADYAVCIGKAEAKDSYLNMLNILITATSLGVDAIHPGYGFLSENYSFAELCEELGIIFIGPSSNNIKLMGNKINALKIMNKVNATDKQNQYLQIYSEENLKECVDMLGLPLIIKYASGGGGKGMRIVEDKAELNSSYQLVLLEAKQSEDNPEVFAEKFITNAKHVEIQVLSDKYGNMIHIGSRDCSMQRNSQKVIEEACADIDNNLLTKMVNISLGIVGEIGYVGAGTIEFLVKDNECYFLEMNTRLQVEHTVSEQVSKIDIVKEQIKIAFGERLSIEQEEVILTNHSIECRINAEDPRNDFAPTPGMITRLELCEEDGIRNDFGFIENNKVSAFYDSLIGKIIVTAPTRLEAIERMKYALDNTIIEGIATNISFNRLLIEEEEFKSNVHTTMYIKNNYHDIKARLNSKEYDV